MSGAKQPVRKTRRATFICYPDETPVADIASKCEYASQHTPRPEGYLGWFAWAQKMRKTHRQIRCAGCGLLVIWVPRQRRSD